ncbi:SHOCT domain-containing protein [Hallella mizrahii]|jgi:hypothetical protein|uniref:SHOCT domain-containing protein n=1 Tax=Hallella mizrahii TaxID=2606637 RepID=A0A7K0KCL4_9BACT|nr:SHOCT domain-containing protein [Hallella mizrahii]MST83662.1 SHOCT domain-containing protein [Hallella mizrahii]
MSLVDHEGEVVYPYSKKTVFNAVMEAANNISGLSLDSADELSGRVTFKAGVSLASWGENIPVQLEEIGANQTKMKVLSTPKTGIMFGGAMDFGKNRQNIEKIINAVSNALANKPKEQINVENTGSTADELLKLKSLLDQKILTQEEFDAQKAKLLSQSIEAPVAPQESSNVDSKESKPIHIESSGKDNTITYVAIAVGIIVFLWMLMAMM